MDHAVVVRLLELLGEAMEAVRAGADPRTRLELALVKAAKPEVDGSTRALLARIERLEQGRAGAGAGPAKAPVERSDPPAIETPAAPPEPGKDPPARPKPDLGASVERAIAAEGAADVESIIDLWPAVVELVGAEHALCGAVITEARPVSISGEDLMVGFPTTAAFLKRQAEDPANRAIVTDALRQVTGERWRLSYELREELGDADGPGSGAEAYTEEEWVARFKEELDAEEVPLESESASPNSAQKGE